MLLDLRSPTVRKLAKYSGASVVAVCVGQPVFWICNGLLGWDAIVSNLVSVSAGAVPNYTINRRWTWSQTGKNRLWGEVVPFWAMSALGVVFSLVAVHYADQRWHSTAINAMAQLFGFGVLWLAKFFVLDKVMWRIVHDLQPDVAIDEAEAGLVGALNLDGTHGEPALPQPNGTNGTNGTEIQADGANGAEPDGAEAHRAEPDGAEADGAEPEGSDDVAPEESRRA